MKKALTGVGIAAVLVIIAVAAHCNEKRYKMKEDDVNE